MRKQLGDREVAARLLGFQLMMDPDLPDWEDAYVDTNRRLGENI
jgi:hypothetical protein